MATDDTDGHGWVKSRSSVLVWMVSVKAGLYLSVSSVFIRDSDEGGLTRMNTDELGAVGFKYKGRPWGTASFKIERTYPLPQSSISGISSQVFPSRSRPVFFLFVPPHCLKKNATLASEH